MAGDLKLAIRKVSSKFWVMQRNRSDFKFFNSCVSESLVPKGLRRSFNLARDVNENELIEELQEIVDTQSSKILNSMLKSSENKLRKSENDFFDEKVSILKQFGAQNGWEMINEAKQLVKKNLRVINFKC